MPKQKKADKTKRPHPIRIIRNRHVPTHDFFENRDLSDEWDINEALDNLVSDLKSDYFLTWEAVICEEQGFSLTKKQKKALGNLIDFGDEWDEERILYINEMPRPSTQWYEIVAKVASHLVDNEPFDIIRGGTEAITEGWPELVRAVQKRGIHLSLPDGMESALGIFPPEVFHQLNLQLCLDSLGGLGQNEELSLENEEQHYRIEWFIECLQQHKGMIRYYNLTLESILTKVKMPSREKSAFIKLMIKHLRLPSEKVCLIDFLFPLAENKKIVISQ